MADGGAGGAARAKRERDYDDEDDDAEGADDVHELLDDSDDEGASSSSGSDAGSEEGSGKEDGGEEDGAGVSTAFEVGVPDSRRTRRAELELCLMQELSAGFLQLLRSAGSDPADVPANLHVSLQQFRNRLTMYQTEANLAIPFGRVLKRINVTFDESEIDALKKEYYPLMMEAAKAAAAQWDKFIPEVLLRLTHSLRYHPARPPVALEPPPGKEMTDDMVRELLGCLPEDADLDLVADWATYVEKYSHLPQAVRDLPPGKFWAHPMVVALFLSNKLPKLGQWYAEMPTSNLSCERAFAVMRNTFTSIRTGTMTTSNAAAELKARCNTEIIDAMMAKFLAKK
jgi:hypothetical protein